MTISNTTMTVLLNNNTWEEGNVAECNIATEMDAEVINYIGQAIQAEVEEQAYCIYVLNKNTGLIKVYDEPTIKGLIDVLRQKMPSQTSVPSIKPEVEKAAKPQENTFTKKPQDNNTYMIDCNNLVAQMKSIALLANTTGFTKPEEKFNFLKSQMPEIQKGLRQIANDFTKFKNKWKSKVNQIGKDHINAMSKDIENAKKQFQIGNKQMNTADKINNNPANVINPTNDNQQHSLH